MFITASDSAVPIHSLDSSGLAAWLAQADAVQARWVRSAGFKAERGRWLAVPDAGGGLACVLSGRDTSDRLWALAHLPAVLPAGDYAFEPDWADQDLQLARIGFGLGGYRFDRYKPQAAKAVRLVVPEAELRELRVLVESSTYVRDLVNTPALDLGPAELAAAAEKLAAEHGADCEVISGERLEQDFPAIHIVGQASSRPPCLIRLQWGEADAPPLALVGKGVVFDSGGLDIKPGDGMVLMKKDMGGAAHVLGLARIIMALGLKVNLRVYIPAVENAISGSAYRPSDIIRTRQGLSVEIGNTDAEGRVVLSDALTWACEQGAERVIDMATLTGAARVALGEDLPPIYARDMQQARAIQDLSFAVEDPLWQLPLYKPYNSYIRPPIADLSNSGTSRFAGSLTAALFLEHFVVAEVDWYHLDIYAWNLGDRPGRPAGGEAQGLRALWAWLKREYGLAAA
ncbi:MAG: leucyl aminopeptidase family protein [Wenzhouxiangella sp.]